MSNVEILLNGKAVPQGTVALQLNKSFRDQIRELLQVTAYTIIDDQIKKGNEPSEILVDGVSNKSIEKATRNIEARFGSSFDKRVIKMIERALVNSIRRRVNLNTGKIANMSNWTWYLQDFEKDSGGRAQKVNPYSLNTLTRRQRLLLIPTGVVNEDGIAYASVVDNRLNARPSSNGGFFYDAKEKLNRNRRFNSFYYCKVGQSERYALPNEVGGTKKGNPKTKCLVIRPRLKKRKTRGRA